MTRSPTNMTAAVRWETRILAWFLILFGAANQAGWILFDLSISRIVDGSSAFFRVEVPAAAVTIPGVALMIAGVGAMLRHEWGFKLASILCAIQLAITATDWRLTGVEVAYAILCIIGIFEPWRVLDLNRKMATSAGNSETVPPEIR